MRDVLAAVRVPTLVIPRPALPGPGHYTAERIRGSEVVELPELRGVYTWVDDEAHSATMAATQRFVSRLTENVESERVLATILFTDIVGSTELAARVGDSAWRELLQRHHSTRSPRARALPGPGGRYGRRRVLRCVRRSGSCRSRRFCDPRRAPRARDRNPGGSAYRRVRGSRRQGRRHRSLDRGTHRGARRTGRGARVEHGQGSRRRLGPSVRGSRRARPQRRTGAMAPVRAGRLARVTDEEHGATLKQPRRDTSRLTVRECSPRWAFNSYGLGSMDGAGAGGCPSVDWS